MEQEVNIIWSGRNHGQRNGRSCDAVDYKSPSAVRVDGKLTTARICTRREKSSEEDKLGGGVGPLERRKHGI